MFAKFNNLQAPENHTAKMTREEVFCNDVNKKLKKIIKNGKLVFHDKDEADYKAIIGGLKKLSKTIKSNKLNAKYERKQYGRYNVTGGYSFQTLPRMVRNYLTDDRVIDVDMVNAFPVIAYNLSKHIGLEHIGLEYYVNGGRDTLAIDFPSVGKTGIKKLFINVLFGMDIDYALKTVCNNNIQLMDTLFDDFKKIYHNISVLLNYVNTSDDFKKIRTWYNRSKNKKGGVLFYILASIERYIIMDCVQFIDNNTDFNASINSIIHDGFHILINDGDKNDIIQKLNDHIHTKYPEFEFMEFIQKPFERNEIEKYFNQEDEESNDDIVLDDDEAGDKIINMIGDGNMFVVQRKLYMFNGRYFEEDVDCLSLREFIRKNKRSIMMPGKDDMDEPIVVYGKESRIKDLVKTIITSKSIQMRLKDFNSRVIDGRKVIMFKNGWWDFRGDTPKWNTEFTSDLLITNIIEWDYVDYEDETVRDEIIQKSYINVYGEEQYEVVLKYLACGIARECLKKVMFQVGATNTGKSVQTNVLQRMLGEGVGEFTNNVFANDNKDAETRKFAVFGMNASKCLMISQESKSDAVLDGDSIKKVASGGRDVIKYRALYCEEGGTHINFSMLMSSNDMPKFTNPSDTALIGRVIIADMPKQFVKVVNNPEKELPMDDDYIQKLTYDKHYMEQHLKIMIDSYIQYRDEGFEIPETMTMKESDWVDEDDDVIGRLNKFIEFTGNHDDMVSPKMIKNILKSIKDKTSIKTMINCAWTKNINLKYSRIRNADGGQVRMVLGCKMRDDELDDDEF